MNCTEPCSLDAVAHALSAEDSDSDWMEISSNTDGESMSSHCGSEEALAEDNTTTISPEDEQRVAAALDQSLISTLSASRGSSTSNSLRDLRLSFPDPLTSSSSDELKRSYDELSEATAPSSLELFRDEDPGSYTPAVLESSIEEFPEKVIPRHAPPVVARVQLGRGHIVSILALLTLTIGLAARQRNIVQLPSPDRLSPLLSAVVEKQFTRDLILVPAATSSAMVVHSPALPQRLVPRCSHIETPTMKPHASIAVVSPTSPSPSTVSSSPSSLPSASASLQPLTIHLGPNTSLIFEPQVLLDIVFRDVRRTLDEVRRWVPPIAELYNRAACAVLYRHNRARGRARQLREAGGRVAVYARQRLELARERAKTIRAEAAKDE